jgi:two-component system chemotaxis response regulator CheY
MSKKRILIVDDDPSILDMLRDGLALSNDDYQVICTTGSLPALRQLEEGSFDLLLTDYQMPGMNGLDLVRAVRQLVPGIRVVLMTAYADGPRLQDRIRALELDGCLRKPFSLHQLHEMIRSSLGTGGA